MVDRTCEEVLGALPPDRRESVVAVATAAAGATAGATLQVHPPQSHARTFFRYPSWRDDDEDAFPTSSRGGGKGEGKIRQLAQALKKEEEEEEEERPD